MERGHYFNNKYFIFNIFNTFFCSIPRAWGNKQKPKDLKTYFQRVFEGTIPEGLWASMAELTPNTKTIVLHPESGLRIFADKINRNVTHWFRDLYWQKANIVATDFFLGNDIIDVAVQTNKYKGICPQSVWSRFEQNDKKDKFELNYENDPFLQNDENDISHEV